MNAPFIALTAEDRFEELVRALLACPDPLDDFEAAVAHLHHCRIPYTEVSGFLDEAIVEARARRAAPPFTH